MIARRTVVAGLAATTVLAADVLAQPAGQRPGQPGPSSGPRPPAGQPPGPGQGPRAPLEVPPPEAKNGPPIIDVHAHLVGRGPGKRSDDYTGAARAAVTWMDQVGIARMLVMPPPYGGIEFAPPYEWDVFIGAIQAQRGRFGFLAGGGSLNPMIHRVARDKSVAPSVEKDFVRQAERALAAGAAGFGEMSSEHFSYFPGHPYNAAPPDHPLFRVLADIAADHGVPIDLHMEAVPDEMPLPPIFTRLSPNNPPRLKANLEPFRRLLAHNRKASIVWSHAGVDATGYRTAKLCREMLDGNANLSMSLATPALRGTLLDESDRLRTDWLSLLGEFPDRFMVGTDSFHLAPGVNLAMPKSWKPRLVVNALPGETARNVAYLNAQRIFNLPAA